MKSLPRVLLIVFLLLAAAGAWLFWSRPQPVDMASYAPSDALLYLEANDPLAVLGTLAGTDALKVSGSSFSAWKGYPNSWSRWFLKTTGIGPVESVVLSRAQIAVVVTNLGAIEASDTLTVKPEVAVVIETHTLRNRIKATAEQALQRLADNTYGKPNFRRSEINGIEFLEWANQDGSRRIVANISNSAIVIANSEAAVQKCVDSASGRTPSLKNDLNFQQRRRDFGAQATLTFGYVPEQKSAQLLSFAVPLLLGRAPGDVSFQKLISRELASCSAVLPGELGFMAVGLRIDT